MPEGKTYSLRPFIGISSSSSAKEREAVSAFFNLIRNGKQSINPKNMDAGSTNLSGTNLNSRRLALSIAKGEPQGWGEYSRRRTHFIQDNKKPTKLVGCAGFLGPCEAFFGGGGGNRTRVRKSSAIGSTCLSQSLSLAGHYPTGREDVRRFR